VGGAVRQMGMALDYKSRIETIEVAGSKVVETIENLIHEGNIRKVTVRQGDRVIAELPLTFGIVGAVLAPSVAAIGAIAALAAGYTIEVERTDSPPSPEQESS
jgi:hypothetical protein